MIVYSLIQISLLLTFSRAQNCCSDRDLLLDSSSPNSSEIIQSFYDAYDSAGTNASYPFKWGPTLWTKWTAMMNGNWTLIIANTALSNDQKHAQIYETTINFFNTFVGENKSYLACVPVCDCGSFGEYLHCSVENDGSPTPASYSLNCSAWFNNTPSWILPPYECPLINSPLTSPNTVPTTLLLSTSGTTLPPHICCPTRDLLLNPSNPNSSEIITSFYNAYLSNGTNQTYLFRWSPSIWNQWVNMMNVNWTQVIVNSGLTDDQKHEQIYEMAVNFIINKLGANKSFVLCVPQDSWGYFGQYLQCQVADGSPKPSFNIECDAWFSRTPTWLLQNYSCQWPTIPAPRSTTAFQSTTFSSQKTSTISQASSTREQTSTFQLSTTRPLTTTEILSTTQQETSTAQITTTTPQKTSTLEQTSTTQQATTTRQLTSSALQTSSTNQQTTTSTQKESTSTTRISTTTPTILSSTTSSMCCPTGWIYFDETDACYKLYNTAVNWSVAESNCESLYENSHLASVHSTDENNFLISFTQTGSTDPNDISGVWIGFERVNSTFIWTDGSNFNFTDWGTGQPDGAGSQGGTGDCGMFHPNPTVDGNFASGQWDDQNCYLNVSYICKVDCHPQTTPTLPPPCCPDGWVYFATTDSCYQFSNTSVGNWSMAEAFCESENSHLASIHSGAENNFILSHTHTGITITDDTAGIWIGLQRVSSVLEWTDATSFNYTNWANNQPDGSGSLGGPGNCGMYFPDPTSDGAVNSGQWDDQNCYLTGAGYVCKIQNNCHPTPVCCPSGWVYFAETNSCYQVNNITGNWSTAEAFCVAQSSHLVSIHSVDENNFVLILTQRGTTDSNDEQGIWMGLNTTPPVFSWTDGSTLNYTNWASGQPDGSGSEGSPGNCGMFHPDPTSDGSASPGQWDDQNCFVNAPAFVCKIANSC